MAGSIVVPAEAAEALCKGERGLLRQDIQSIQGTFVRGDVLHIYDEEGNERARGLANFTAEETIILARNKEIPAKQLLGFQTNATIVSRDNIVVLDGRHIQWDTPPEDELEQIQDT